MRKILVADDDHDILTVIQILLQINSFDVRTVSRWEYISNEIKDFSPDLIMLDIALGGADGRVLCKQIKSTEATRHIPVILLSAFYDLINNTRGCMANDVVSKPFEASALIATIRKNLEVVH